MQAVWAESIAGFFGPTGLVVKEVSATSGFGGRQGNHGPELVDLLEAMQGIFRSDPAATW